MNEEKKENKLTKKDIFKAYLNWIFFAESNYNYERMQATSFAHSMVPIIEKLYTSKEERAEALSRHLAFFNTEPVVGSVIHGITIALEENKSNGEPITGEGINAIKSGLMGPIAGIGDTLTQGVITPILLSICISLTIQGNISGPILFLIAQYTILFGISYTLWNSGYKFGNLAVEEMLSGGIVNRVIEGASIIGTLVMGGLVGDFVSISTPIEFSLQEGVFSLQTDLFDKIFPGLLPLLATLVVLKLVKKGISPLKIMGIIIIFGFLGGLIGIL